MNEPGRFHDATLVRIRQPDHTGGAALQVAHDKGRDLRLWCEFFRLAFPSPVRDACGLRGSSEYTPRGGVSGGVRQLR
jgi:hypothetical protein